MSRWRPGAHHRELLALLNDHRGVPLSCEAIAARLADCSPQGAGLRASTLCRHGEARRIVVGGRSYYYTGDLNSRAVAVRS